MAVATAKRRPALRLAPRGTSAKVLTVSADVAAKPLGRTASLGMLRSPSGFWPQRTSAVFFNSASTLLRELPTLATASLTAFCVTLCFWARYLTS